MKTRICNHCHTEQPPDRFDFGKAYCRACGPAVNAERRKRKNERSRAWYWANREKALQVAKESGFARGKLWQRTRSDRLAYLKRWRAANKERIQAYSREYKARKATPPAQEAAQAP